jgi:hypothetical protein
MKKLPFFYFIIILCVLPSCSDNSPERKFNVNNIAVGWADVTLTTIYETPPNSPTYTSRSLGYIGLTMYESVVHGSVDNQSLAGQLNALATLPMPEVDKPYDWVLSLNAGQARILKLLYPHMSSAKLLEIENYEKGFYDEEIKNVSDPLIIDRSVAFGQSVADAIFEWSKTDGGHEGYLHNFDPTYVFPTGPGFWSPPFGGQSASQLPLHPHWGNNRTFISENSNLPIPEMLPYATTSSSEYYKQFKAVYDQRNALTSEQKNIAAWWADDPTQTSSPPGHSYNLASIAIATDRLDMYKAAEVCAKVGMAVADSFINCWKCKYIYHAERPYAFISQFINPNYVQFWPEPPFPAFSSGHATQSAAAAKAMESVFGPNFKMVDNTYAKRAPDFAGIVYRSRSFNSIWETAVECANSRFYGGIHTPQDNEQGQIQGITIGKNVVALEWRK